MLVKDRTIQERATDYKAVFTTPAGQRVLDDLKVRGFYDQPTFHADSRVHAANEGMRMLLLHILQQVEKTPDELSQIYQGRPIQLTTEAYDE